MSGGGGGNWRKSSFCGSDACVEVEFRRSSFCGESSCVEVVRVRDGKQTFGHILEFTVDEWSAFVAGVKAGEFDIQEAS